MLSCTAQTTVASHLRIVYQRLEVHLAVSPLLIRSSLRQSFSFHRRKYHGYRRRRYSISLGNPCEIDPAGSSVFFWEAVNNPSLLQNPIKRTYGVTMPLYKDNTKKNGLRAERESECAAEEINLFHVNGSKCKNCFIRLYL